MSTVIVAESELATRERMEKVLTGANLNVEAVASMSALLNRLKANVPDLVLLDVEMPRMGGLEVLEKLREFDSRVPVILVTAKGNVPSALPNALLVSGALDYITKPVDSGELLLRVRNALSKAHKLGTPLAVNLPELHDPESGRIDADRVARFLGVPLAQLAEAIGANYATVHKTPAAPSLQEALSPLKQAIDLVSRVTGNPREVRIWLNNPHDDLGGMTPIRAILTGRANAIVTLLGNALAGIPT